MIDWNLDINIERREDIVSFRFVEGTQAYTKNIDIRHLKNEKQRMIILREIARDATNQLVVPKIVDGILNALITSALKGDNLLD